MESRDAVKLLMMVSLGVGTLVLPVGDGARRYLHLHHPHLNFTETCAAHRYRAEEHRVRTADGYLLTVFRMGRAGCAPRRPPVLLMHGLLQSADAFLDPGPRAGLPYLLADRCFDVWVGNMRGNYYARRHETLDPDRDAAFWDFSIDNIGLHDVPTTIDYVLSSTGSQKLNYIGYSQGASAVLIMCSELPSSCDKVGLQIALAPAVKLTNMRSSPFRALAAGLSATHRALGPREILARESVYRELASLLCVVSTRMCSGVVAFVDAAHPGSVADAALHRVFAHFPAGTSDKMFVKYAQSLASDGFEKFDHGADNMRVYGSPRPPPYDLSAATAPTVLLYADNDHLVDARDVRWLRQRLPDVVDVVRIDSPLWNHFDFLYSQHIPDLLYPHIDRYLTLYTELLQL